MLQGQKEKLEKDAQMILTNAEIMVWNNMV